MAPLRSKCSCTISIDVEIEIPRLGYLSSNTTTTSSRHFRNKKAAVRKMCSVLRCVALFLKLDVGHSYGQCSEGRLERSDVMFAGVVHDIDSCRR